MRPIVLREELAIKIPILFKVIVNWAGKMLLEEDISEEFESSEVVEDTEEEGEVIIDQLKFFIDISKAWYNVIHHNSSLEILTSIREKSTIPKTHVLGKRAEKKTKREKKAKKKSTKKTKSKKRKNKSRE